jgi:hypothetical protein
MLTIFSLVRAGQRRSILKTTPIAGRALVDKSPFPSLSPVNCPGSHSHRQLAIAAFVGSTDADKMNPIWVQSSPSA